MTSPTDLHPAITETLIAIVERFMAAAQPDQRLQLYPNPNPTDPDWWGAITDANGANDWGWPTAEGGLAYVTAMPLRELTPPPATLTPAQRDLLRGLFPAFRAWARGAPAGSSDHGPALVFTPRLSGWVFYDGEEIAHWAQLAEAEALSNRMMSIGKTAIYTVAGLNFEFSENPECIFWKHVDNRQWEWVVAWAKPVDGQPGYFYASVVDRSPKGQQAKYPTDNTAVLTGRMVDGEGRVTSVAPLADVPANWLALLAATAELIQRGDWPIWRKPAAS